MFISILSLHNFIKQLKTKLQLAFSQNILSKFSFYILSQSFYNISSELTFSCKIFQVSPEPKQEFIK